MHAPLSDITELPFAQQAWCMVEENNFTQFCQGWYADIPSYHLPQWIAALSMDIFGKNALAFRLPFLVMAFVGAFAMWQWTKLFFRDKSRASMATLMWLCSFHVTFQIFNGHPFFIGSVLMICTLWFLTKWQYSRSGADALIAGLFAALSFASAGIFVIMILLGYIILTDLAIHYRKPVVRRGFLLFLLSLWLCALPVLYALTSQYGFSESVLRLFQQLYLTDLARHPASVLSFSYMHGVNYMIIGFLPWTALFVLASLIHLRRLLVIKTFTKMHSIWLIAALIGIYCTIIQPGIIQYMSFIMPFAILFSVDDLVRIMANENVKFARTAVLYHFVLALTAVFLLAIVTMIALYSFPMRELRFIPIFALLIVLFVTLYFFTDSELQRNLLLPIGVSLFFILFFKIHLLPRILQQELMPQMAQKIQQRNIPPNQLFRLNDDYTRSLIWYMPNRTRMITENQIQQRTQPFWLIIDQRTPEEFLSPNLMIKEAIPVSYYHTQENFHGFFDPIERANAVKTAYLVRYEPKPK
ncbi:MAG: glycosyltransferase family 39 protein [Weeksellaceae bacterium]|nr:glycosyltransferase family 39 protein [Weeksellaceae bacterium]